tara:strand:- start:40 stop:1044 length:1005 start_codon:yes stop_codon:yes gene_type:complete
MEKHSTLLFLGESMLRILMAPIFIVVAFLITQSCFAIQTPETNQNEALNAAAGQLIKTDGVTRWVSPNGQSVVLFSEDGFYQRKNSKGEILKSQIQSEEEFFERLSQVPQHMRYQTFIAFTSGAGSGANMIINVAQQQRLPEFPAGGYQTLKMISSLDQWNWIEATDGQSSNLKLLVEDFTNELDELKKSFNGMPADERNFNIQLETSKRYKEFKSKVMEILLPHQLLLLAELSPSKTGLIKSLTDGLLGDAVELTKEQKQQIAKKTNDTIERLKAQIADARKQLRNELDLQLNQKQQKLLDESLGQILDAQLNQTSTDVLIRIHDFPETDQDK